MKRNQIGWMWNGLVGAIFMAGNWVPLRWVGLVLFALSLWILEGIERDNIEAENAAPLP